MNVELGERTMARSGFAGAIVLALVLTACGGGTVVGSGEDPPSTTTATTMSPQPQPPDDAVVEDGTSTPPIDREDRAVDEPDTTPETLPESVVSPQPQGVTGEAPRDLIDAVIADLVARTGADLSEVTVVVDEFVIWNDGSLGCPQPGQMYTQALVEGYRIVLGYGGATFDYHASQRGFFVLCEGTRGGPSVPEPPPGEPTS